ncbi:EAL domain-containing protein [Cohnella lubricantis]|uniref:EAL domain-containing protein n=1 Tax=Cohnella lubricantis TaxID=2163172 RepID=A0A841TJQ9_9BACL|nr:EAL domain-containing protein [Cohnella lubricantis]MBB6679458.1 EAL domain-containing protein [Cohnella lubricantis]MBP2118195.1 EAL domain-containing protein (putative c-di-GMP-specific phosphodiesterase class I) [Cohnella lubricantis]
MSHLSHTSAIPSAPPADQLTAFYQPILALDSRRIIGYELLGRQRVGDEVRSLGPFFTHPQVPELEQIRIDRLLREQAFAKLEASPDSPTIFVNIKPTWISKHYHESGELYTLQLLRKYGIEPGRVCIEITEEEFGGPMSDLVQVIDLYRAAGCRIAIDDVGSGFSNYDRIAQIRPHLLKVDIHLMKRSASHSGYLGILRSFSSLAEQMGASLLVEGVETRDELQRAIQIGARYLQGYLFAPAEPNFRAPDEFVPLIEEELNAHRRQVQISERSWLERSLQLAESARSFGFDRLAASAAGSCPTAEEADRILEQWLPLLDECCLYVFMCRNNGVQLSSTLARKPDGSWRRDEQFRGSDWSWRPYFIPHLLQSKQEDTRVSPKYADLETHAWVRTVSICLGEFVLFLDIRDDIEPSI